jgi:putative transposase
MQRNELYRRENVFYRILSILEERLLVIDCVKQHMPDWVTANVLDGFILAQEQELHVFLGIALPEYETLNQQEKRVCHERYSVISPLLVFLDDESERNKLIKGLSIKLNLSSKTIRKYLVTYLVFSSLVALKPTLQLKEKVLSYDEINFRWAINKFYYSPKKLTIRRTYLLLLRDKYTVDGKLLEHYPKFHRFNYFFQRFRKKETELISREGLSQYQRNHRPLLGDSVRSYVGSIGTSMIDSTVLDLYIVNDAGNNIGRPILTAIVDSFSGLALGCFLSLEGGIFSITNLLMNTIKDKVKWCRQFGIDINEEDWPVHFVPSVIITDRGREYLGNTFEQLTELGIKIETLPPYRPELKSRIEIFMKLIQDLYKPSLLGKGVVRTDFQERGVQDYRRTASLTLNQIEKVILHCILHYNNSMLIDLPPHTPEYVKPTRLDIFNHQLESHRDAFIDVDERLLHLTLLPRQIARFTRRGLIVNTLRYRSLNFKESFLNGGEVTVAYDPNNVSQVWLLKDKEYHPFELIEKDYLGQDTESVNKVKKTLRLNKRAHQELSLQAQLDLLANIDTNIYSVKQVNPSIKNIRSNRAKERNRIRLRKEVIK